MIIACTENVFFCNFLISTNKYYFIQTAKYFVCNVALFRAWKWKGNWKHLGCGFGGYNVGRYEGVAAFIVPNLVSVD